MWDIAQGEIAADPPPAARKPAARPRGARKGAMPEALVPQLAMQAETAPDGDDWLHEIKYDGYRLLAYIADGAARLLTRSGLDWTGKFPSLARALAALPVASAIIDGELVALAADGTTSFAELQNAIARGDTSALVFFAFDLLYRDGDDLTGAALEDRKLALAAIVMSSGDGSVRYSDHQVGRGPDFFRLACRHRLEGIIAKRRDRPYRPGRSRNWLKIKCQNRDEFIVIGFTEPAGQRHGLGALILGYYDRAGRLRYAGRVGTGFADRQLADLRAQLAAIECRDPPAPVPQGVATKGVHWTMARLVAQIRYGGWTADAMLRHSSFEGLREDKPPQDVVYDPPVAAAAPADPLPAAGRDGSISFAGVRLTNPARVLYPQEGITKLALAQYYAAIADWALPHLAGRPLSLLRCPEGYDKECFYQKHLGSGVPDAIGRVEIAEKSVSRTHLVVEDLAGLVGTVQMGVLEIHPWGSTVGKIETPDRVTFDFDPDEGLPWLQVTAAALEMREALLGIGLQSFAKTTGGKGLHVVVPLMPKLGWDAIKEFSKWVAERFVAAYPDRFTANPAKRARQGRIFIDYLRNARGATAVGAYSPRARQGAPVATPLFWEEVEQGVTANAFTVATVPRRLAGKGADPWAEMPVLRQSVSARVRKEIGI